MAYKQSPFPLIEGTKKTKDEKKMTAAEMQAASLAAAEKTEGIEVKMSEHEDIRDRLARKAKYKRRSGKIPKGMEQSARSSDYKYADKYLASKGDESAKTRLKEREARVTKAKKAYANNPNMTQKEIDKILSGN